MVAQLSPWGQFSLPVVLQVVSPQDLARRLEVHKVGADLDALALVDRVMVRDDVISWGDAPWRSLLVHELAHVLAFQRAQRPDGTQPYLPTWFREGMAVVAADGQPDPRDRRRIVQLVSSRDGPGLVGLTQAAARDLSAEPALTYAVAAHAFSCWLERFGQIGLTKTFQMLRQGHGFAAGVRLATSIAEDEFLSDWQEQLLAEARTG